MEDPFSFLSNQRLEIESVITGYYTFRASDESLVLLHLPMKAMTKKTDLFKIKANNLI